MMQILMNYRLGVASRALAAIGGGYAVSSLAVTALALALPGREVDRVVAATLTGLVVYPCAVMWCFATRTATRAWLGLIAAGLLLSAVIFFGGRA
jgi:predicted Co/Zn/Cd cation transporter (cation efflux family)